MPILTLASFNLFQFCMRIEEAVKKGGQEENKKEICEFYLFLKVLWINIFERLQRSKKKEKQEDMRKPRVENASKEFIISAVSFFFLLLLLL